MTPTSIANAKTDLYNLLASDSNGTPKTSISTYVTKVYGYEPGHNDIVQGCPVTILSSRLGMEEIEFTVRIYQAVDHFKNAQDNLDGAVWAVDAAIGASAEYGRSDWQIGFDQSLGVLVAQSSVICGRQDF